MALWRLWRRWLGQVEGDGQPGLPGSQDRFPVLQGPDFSNQTCTVQLRHVPGRPDGGQRPGHVTDRHLLWLSLVGPLIAVHGTTLSGTSDIWRPTNSGATICGRMAP